MNVTDAQTLAMLPLQVLLLLALWKVYTDGRADRRELLDKVDQLLLENGRQRDRLMRIELKLGMDEIVEKRKNSTNEIG